MNKFAHYLKRLLWCIPLFLTVWLAACGGGGGGRDPILGSGGATIAIPPTVTSTDPANGATGVALNKKIVATFSQAMDPATIATATFTLTGPGTTVVAGTVSYTGLTATFSPTVTLSPFTVYTSTVTSGAKDVAGNPLASNYVWNWTTGAAPDTTAPMVTSTDPANKAIGVALNKKISATFSEAMDPATITTANFTLTGPGATVVSGAVSYSGVTATFTPTVALTPNTVYTSTVTSGVKDLAGNAMASNYVWTWTTGSTLDTTAPLVTSTDPANGAAAVALNKKISATFSEAMDPATITTATYTLAGPGNTAVLGTVTYAGFTATFSPTAPLAPNTVYTSTVTTGSKDLAGNALTSNYVWTWTTGAAQDTTAPFVIATGAYGSTGVLGGGNGYPVNRNSTATFNESMDPLTITTATYLLAGPGSVPVTGTVTYVGTTATFNPTVDLAPSTTYTSTITTGAKDLAGNTMANNYVWSWTTGAAADTTTPTIVSTVPANLAANVPVSQEVTALFSEAMLASTVNNVSFTLKQGIAPVAGNVSYVGTTATFSPSSPLLANTTYTAQITNAATDLAGNALVAGLVPNSWSFTTAAAVVVPPSGPAAVNIGCAANFAILAGSTVTNTGPTSITGDLGLSPGSAVTGFPTGTVTGGAIHINDTLANNAKGCLDVAYGDAAGRSTAPITVSGNLGGQTLPPGLYKSTPTLSSPPAN